MYDMVCMCYLLQGGRFLWDEEKTTILCGPPLTLVEKESSCVYHLY